MAMIQQNLVRIRRMAGNRDQLTGCHGSHGPTKLWSSSLMNDVIGQIARLTGTSYPLNNPLMSELVSIL